MCTCAEYADIEFQRKAVRARIKVTPALRRTLSLVAKHKDGEHKLYSCPACGQFWQSSRAWNWGAEEYLFRVPTVDTASWLAEVFVQPDELLIFTAVMSQFLRQNRFSPGPAACTVAGCSSHAVIGVGTCLRHHVEALQREHQLPSAPLGRWFSPYVRENVIPAL